MNLTHILNRLDGIRNQLDELRKADPTDKTHNMKMYDQLHKQLNHYHALLDSMGKGVIWKCNTSEGVIYLVNISKADAKALLASRDKLEVLDMEEIWAGVLLS